MIDYKTANITPPLLQAGNQMTYMERIGSDIGQADNLWRYSFFIRKEDVAEFKATPPELQAAVDDNTKQAELSQSWTWPRHAVRIGIYATGFVQIDLPDTANAANIIYLGSESYRLPGPMIVNLGQLKNAPADNNRPMRAMTVSPKDQLHRAIHHMVIPHKHGVDITDDANMPPASPIILARPAAVQPFEKQTRVPFASHGIGL